MALPGFFTRNWTLKLSAFGIALLLWIAVKVELPATTQLESVPVRVDLADPQWALAGEPAPASVSLSLRGPSREVWGVNPSVVIPVDEVTSADTTVLVDRQWVRLSDRDLTVEGIQPTAVRLRFEGMLRVDLPPALRFGGELPEELAFVRSPSPLPDRVRVMGPESRILDMDSVPVEPLDLASVDGSGTMEVAVDTTGLEGIVVQPSRLEVELEVTERAERRHTGVTVSLAAPEWEETWAMAPQEVDVFLSGADAVLDAVEPGSYRVVVDLEGEGLPSDPGEQRAFPLRVEGLPALVRGRVDPAEVTVTRLEGEP